MATDPWQLDRIEAQASTPKAWAEGKKLADGGAFADIVPYPNARRAWMATTRGSTGSTYTTVVFSHTNHFGFDCDCASYQRPCKHALGLAYFLASRPELRPEPEPPPAVAPERDALVRACFANPKANLPRLVLADYLDEHGESDWATILRIQCELAPPKKKGEKPQIKRGMAKPLKEAVTRVFERFGDDLVRYRHLEFQRGFLRIMTQVWHLQQLDAQAEQLVQLFREGWVETCIMLGGLTGQESPEVLAVLRQAGTLDFGNAWTTDDGLLAVATELRPGLPDSRVQKVIVAKRYQSKVARLMGDASQKKPPVQPDQTYWNLTPAKFDTILDAGVLRGVTRLSLSGDVGADGLRRLAESGALTRLRHLTLHDITAAPGQWSALWSARADQLQSLLISSTPIGDDGIAALCAGSLPPSSLLSLQSVGLTAAGANTLAACPRLNTLNQLTLSDNPIGDGGLGALLASPHLANVLRFELSNCDLTGEAIVSAAFAAPHRRELSLIIEGLGVVLRRNTSGVGLVLHSYSNGRAQLSWPAGTVCPEPLTSLEINGGAIRKGELRRLGDWLEGRPPAKLAITHCSLRNGDLPDVLALVERLKPTTLDLSGNEIGVKGCEAMAESDALASVQSLHLRGNPIRVTGALALAGSTKRASLKYFHAAQQGYTAAEKKRIAKAFTDVKVKL